MPQKNWWRNPYERNVHIEDLKIGWLELFYDLAHIIAISKMTGNLSLQIKYFRFPELLGGGDKTKLLH